MILVADERQFRTNFNLQYLLGNYDCRYFEEVHYYYPVARALKVKQGVTNRFVLRRKINESILG